MSGLPWEQWRELAKEREKEMRREAEREKDREEKLLSIRDIPLITFSLVLANIVIFAYFSSQSNYENVILQWGFTPNNIAQLRHITTLITHAFLHADLLHLFYNMFIFFQFGYLCERKMGMYKFAFFYFACAILAAMFHALFNLSSEIPCVGASGAIFGVLVGYALLFPERKVYLMLGHVPIKVPSFIGIIFVLFLETIYVFLGINPYIAHTAHIGGGIAGVIMTAMIYPKKATETFFQLLDALIPSVPPQPN